MSLFQTPNVPYPSSSLSDACACTQLHARITITISTRQTPRSSLFIFVCLQNISLHLKLDFPFTSSISWPDLNTSVCAENTSCTSFRSTDTVLVSGGLLCANKRTSIYMKVFSPQKWPAARSPFFVLPMTPSPWWSEACWPLPTGSCCSSSSQEHFCKRRWSWKSAFIPSVTSHMHLRILPCTKSRFLMKL